MINYSIIIPHKNIPKLLERCLASIPQRDDLEIIVVDDNSDPSIVDFENFPGRERDDVIVVFDKTSKGPGYARNIALDRAIGNKILFCDADDYFNYCLGEILDDYKDDETDTVFFKELSVNSDTYTYNLYHDRVAVRNSILDDYLKDKNQNEYRLKFNIGSPCGRLYSHDIINKYQVRFPLTFIHQDIEFNYLYNYNVRTIKIDERAIYTVTYSKSSSSYFINDAKIIQKCHVLARREKFYREHNIPIQVNPYEMWSVMSSLKQQNRENLYKECCKIWEEYGTSMQEVERRITQYQKDIRLDRLKDKIRARMKSIANKLYR